MSSKVDSVRSDSNKVLQQVIKVQNKLEGQRHDPELSYVYSMLFVLISMTMYIIMVLYMQRQSIVNFILRRQLAAADTIRQHQDHLLGGGPPDASLQLA